MGSDSLSFLPALLLLAGFYWVLAAGSPRKRTLAWCLMQSGPVVFLLFQGGPSPLGRTLLLLTLGSGLVTALALFSLASLQQDLPSGTASKRKER